MKIKSKKKIVKIGGSSSYICIPSAIVKTQFFGADYVIIEEMEGGVLIRPYYDYE